MTDAQPVTVLKVLGAVLLRERLARNLTQSQLARAASLSQATVSRIEQAQQREVGLASLRALAAALSLSGPAVTAGDLLARAEAWVPPLLAMNLPPPEYVDSGHYLLSAMERAGGSPKAVPCPGDPA